MHACVFLSTVMIIISISVAHQSLWSSILLIVTLLWQTLWTFFSIAFCQRNFISPLNFLIIFFSSPIWYKTEMICFENEKVIARGYVRPFTSNRQSYRPVINDYHSFHWHSFITFEQLRVDIKDVILDDSHLYEKCLIWIVRRRSQL